MAQKKLRFDTRDTFWRFWSIVGEDGNYLPVLEHSSDIKFRLRPDPARIESRELLDLEFQRSFIARYKEFALDIEAVRIELKVMRELARRDKHMQRKFNSIYRALLLDGREMKTELHSDELKIIIRADLDFFEKILRRPKGKSIDKAVSESVKLEREYNTYKNVYYKTIRIFNHLIHNNFKEEEALHFLRSAGESVDRPHVQIEANPGGRPLMYVKKVARVWGLYGYAYECKLTTQ